MKSVALVAAELKIDPLPKPEEVRSILLSAYIQRAKLSSVSSCPKKYARLLAEILPKRIDSDAEFDRFVETMEKLARAISQGSAGPEEIALHGLLATLIQEYDDRVCPTTPSDPIGILHYLMEKHALSASDLTDVFGARSTASLVLNRRRELSKAHIRKLAERFRVSPAVFL